MEEGSVPEAVLNYLCLLGWSPKHNREKMPVEETIRLFDLPQILRHNARFDHNKLRWLDAEYIREMAEDRFRELGIAALSRTGLPVNTYSADYARTALATCRGKIKRFGDLPAYAGFYFKEEVQMDPVLAEKEFTPKNKERLRKFSAALSRLPGFDATAIEQTLKSLAAELGVKAGVLVHPVRLACTGAAAGPSLYHLMEVLGKERVLKRLAPFA
jgi:glutamyl-tRNA synthetase